MAMPIYETVLGFVQGIFKPAMDALDDLHLSKEEKAVMKNALDLAMIEATQKQMDLEARKVEAESAAAVAQAQVLVAEAKGDSWLQRNWRPLLMTTIIAMLINNFLIYPYLAAIFPAIQQTPIPTACWAMLGSATGVYTFGRSWEKREQIKATVPKIAEVIKSVT